MYRRLKSWPGNVSPLCVSKDHGLCFEVMEKSVELRHCDAESIWRPPSTPDEGDEKVVRSGARL